ncbi:MAG TPA: hypothetical protein DHV60_00300 [Verrucomicrobiales bacterium]|jgi:endonuclease/exonuclease/phosphatase family metal-dependent hydrolase|nr:hypothetical protein [Verrucomicrobiales bacterium]
MLKYLFLILSLVSYLQADSISITAVTYNIRNDNKNDKGALNWDDRKNKITDYLLKKNASIIGLQEVKHNQLEDVVKLLPDHRYVGVGRDDGKTRGEYSPIFYNVKIWKPDPDGQGTFWLSNTPEIVASRTWGNWHNRICSWVRLIHINSGKAVYVYNTHWDHKSQNAREKSAELILNKIRSSKHKNEPFLLMGDFNATTSNKAIKTLLASPTLNDPGVKQFSTYSRWQASLVSGLRIDHLFISNHWNNSSVIVESNGDPAASDHHPVILKAILPN